ncbi:PRC-barrel domain-containing protein [Noviherbaspirillum sp. ST9]|uniref:PRC-barrel domain containing protein n=1 Tax=Noviherbaspirillum sp. ST9 TaxID=3401606 RepID=UPI003B58717E
MGILQSTEALRDFSVVAADGRLGYVADACFDERHWTIRHLLVNTESTLPFRKVLISPSSLFAADWEHRTLFLGLTTQQAWSGTAIEAVGQAATSCHMQHERQLRWCGDVAGCDILTKDDEPVGHIDDLLFDEEHWKIVSMVVETRNWWPGRRIAIPPRRIVRASWPAMIVVVDVTRGQFEPEDGEDADGRIAARSPRTYPRGRRPPQKTTPGTQFAVRSQ